MTSLPKLANAPRVALAFLASLLMVAGLMVATPSAAHAANRDWLRPDATGTCDWDPANFWVQRCDVWSEATGHNITVQIQPAARDGNAGLYLLDGLRATNEGNAWIRDVNAASVFADSNITLVMPVGGAASFYADWDGPATYNLHDPVTYQWETFLTQELPVYLEQNFGVARNNNAIAGLSMGGTAALNLAAQHPGQFRQSLSYSGYLTTTLPGAQTILRVALLDAGGFNINAMYGSMLSPRRFENDPFLNMGGLGGNPVYISAASGLPAPEDAGVAVNDQFIGSALEILSNLSTRAWEAKARAQGINVSTDYPMAGIHNWNQWNHQLVKTKPLILDTMGAW
ncbi:alpha/beta hydrolase [Corynebacterium tapiri]|uniref:Esterase family protein n=1 Tax=Corynebacterium tapiri TaxID=1448266 RepID=A0A5C4U1S0_9CORY|nr:alpha/beta hydrolase family protein [Corynebacterium tapiri]TNL95584.1 esterase family protein [Corynebacterium tapiri]